mgnify:CR=1 FL=1
MKTKPPSIWNARGRDENDDEGWNEMNRECAKKFLKTFGCGGCIGDVQRENAQVIYNSNIHQTLVKYPL